MTCVFCDREIAHSGNMGRHERWHLRLLTRDLDRLVTAAANAAVSLRAATTMLERRRDAQE